MNDSKPNDQLIVLHTFQSLAEAEVVKSFLESQGVTSFINDKFINNMYSGVLNSVTGGYRLTVKSDDLTLARELLDNQKPLADNFIEGIPCPRCQSLKTQVMETKTKGVLNSVKGIIGGLLSFLIMVPYGKSQNRSWKCLSCGHSWCTK